MNPTDLPANDPKDVIVHFLRNSAAYGFRHVPVLQTVQFLRACSIPTHQLHDVAFRNTAGQAWTFRFLLFRANDGPWSVVEYSANPQQETALAWASAGPNDRPWLLLSESTVAPQATPYLGGEEISQDVWKTFNDMRMAGDREQAQTFIQALQECLRTTPDEEKGQEIRKILQAFQQPEPKRPVEGEQHSLPYHFLAFGEVIDRGFDIVRVRLVSSNGIIFENTIEDGLVLLASHQRVPRPLQAELYNSSGELVSRQTVLDPFRIPPDAKFRGFFGSAS